MKKLFLVLISLLLLTGVANSVEWTQAMTADYAAQNTGKSVATASSVLLRVYYRGTGLNPSVGCSADSVVLYDDGAADLTTSTIAAATNTVAELVAAINADADWVAIAGPDSYGNYPIDGAVIASEAGVTTGQGINTYVGSTLASARGIYLDSSTARGMTCGVEADQTAVIRLKDLDTRIDPTLATTVGTITIDVYDGNTLIRRRVIGGGSYLGTGAGTSASTIEFADRGLATTKGNSLCVVVSSSTVITSVEADWRLQNLSITYDKLRP